MAYSYRGDHFGDVADNRYIDVAVSDTEVRFRFVGPQPITLTLEEGQRLAGFVDDAVRESRKARGDFD